MSIYPRLTPRGRRAWAIAGVVAGIVGIAVALYRGDRAAAVLIAVAGALLAGVYLWGAGGEDDGGEDRG